MMATHHMLFLTATLLLMVLLPSSADALRLPPSTTTTTRTNRNHGADSAAFVSSSFGSLRPRGQRSALHPLPLSRPVLLRETQNRHRHYHGTNNISSSSSRRRNNVLSAHKDRHFVPLPHKRLLFLWKKINPILLLRTTKTTTTTTTTLLRGGAVLSSAVATSPALSVWLGPALACALAYALYNLFIKKASASIDPILGGVLLQIVAALLGAVLLGVQQFGVAKKSATTATAAATLQITRIGIAWAVAAGAAVGSAELLSFVISSLGVPASKSIPVIIGGSVLLGTLLGALWLGERLSVKGWLGIVLIAAGIALVGMDNSSGASLH